METTEISESSVTWRSSHNGEVHGRLVRLARHRVVFEVYGPSGLLRTSEVLSEFEIVLRERTIYSGRATVSSLVATELMEVCEASLNEGSWQDVDFTLALGRNGKMRAMFNSFIQDWQKWYRIQPEYKVIIADMQSFLTDLRFWADQLELGLRALPAEARAQTEDKLVAELAPPLIPCVNTLFEKFEAIALSLEEDSRAAHRSYMRRQLHPLVLCAPFAHRTYEKPLGYAGDYEMVNMIVRNGFEGGSLFAKLLNTWFLRQPPAEAHRNRIQYLKSRLEEEAARAARAGRRARILNLGCGPAVEVQEFLKESKLSDCLELTLLDFNDQTIQYARTALEDIKKRFHRTTGLTFQKKSVLQVLKEAARATSPPQHEMVYCAGLFDYLNDRACKQLMDIFYDWTAPGGLVATTNVEPANPMRNGMEHLLDWTLIYRTGAGMRTLAPRQAQEDAVSVYSDPTGVNVLLEVRKFSNG